ncbi:hypothetical protein ElyMa_002080200, partial [Elysia marginata]
MNGYLNLQREERSTDLLDYSRRNTDQFPNIAALAKRYLSAPAVILNSWGPLNGKTINHQDSLEI